MYKDLDDWFVQEVLPQEASLMRYVRRNWRDANELPDLRQEVYVRVYETAKSMLQLERMFSQRFMLARATYLQPR